jgi:hypothetical protein
MGKINTNTKPTVFKELFEKLWVLGLIFPMVPHGPPC